MRQAGTLITKHDAERFANYLLSLGISSKVEPAADAWAIWVHDENQIPRSKQELEQFQREPADRRYVDAEQAARQVRREEAERVRQAQKNYVDMRNEWASPWRRRPVTVALIASCVLVYLGIFEAPLEELRFSMAEIEQGEVWRLVTPIFLHFGLAHLLFNMWWLYDLGSLIERKLNPALFALLILAIAVPSNFAQYKMSLPNSEFGGMSGVVYGLFGYAWVRGRLDPTCGLYLRPEVAMWMIGWFALCAAGAIGNVANWAHGGGLAAGALLGYLAYLRDHLAKKQ